MELQTFIDTHSDYTEKFRSYGLKVNTHKGFLIVKYRFGALDDKIHTKEFQWLRYCRGAVIDTESHRLVAIPPPKAEPLPKAIPLPKAEPLPEAEPLPNQEDTEDTGTPEYQSLIDGTMVNVWFNTKEKQWTISTRGDIGGNNRWSKGSFKSMFEECFSPDIYDTLDPQCSYSFVMRHRDNRNVSPIYQNEAYLVEMFRILPFNVYTSTLERTESEENLLLTGDPVDTDPRIVRVPHSDFPDILKVDSTKNKEAFMRYHDNPKTPPLPYHCKGYTVKIGNQRYKRLNPLFEQVQELRGETNNPCLNYLILRKKGVLKEYLKYFPENVHTFTEYRNKLHTLSNDLYTCYKNTHIYKTSEKKDVPYHLKPLLYEIHGLYLKDKNPIRWSDIKDYIHSLEPKRLMFAINYL